MRNAECGVRNAELQGGVIRITTPTFTFRIPHSAFRISHSALDMIIPARYQPPLPLDRLLIPLGAPGAGDRMELDVVIVGAGPAGLAAAIELAQLAKREGTELSIGVLEKAAALGEHSLSGAVVNPRAFRELFPEMRDSDFPFRGAVERERVCLLTSRAAIPLPAPPTMRNRGNYVASLCEIVRWLGGKAEAHGVNVFTGFPAERLLVEGDRVVGVRTAATGLDRDGRPLANYLAPNDLVAKVTALAEGTRGMLSQAWCEWQRVPAENPQIFALGVKEIWETKRPLDRIVHTLGWPLPADAFGGSFMYPLEPTLVALGLVVGLDYPDAALDVHVPPGGRLFGDGARRLRPDGERLLHNEGPVPHAEHAPRLSVRLLHRWLQGGAHVAHGRAVPGREDRDGARCGRRPGHSPGREPGAVRPRRPAHLLEGGRRLQVRQRDPRHDPDPSRRGERRGPRGRGVLRADVPGRRVRAVGRDAAGERAELRGLQSDRRAGPALDPAGGRERAEVQEDVRLESRGRLGPKQPVVPLLAYTDNISYYTDTAITG